MKKIIPALLVVAIWGGIAWGMHAGGRALWSAYTARQVRLTDEKVRKAAFRAVFEPCFERLNPGHSEERRQRIEEKVGRLLDNIENPYARKRQNLREEIQESYMEERHHREYAECMKGEAEKQGRTLTTGATR